MQPAEAKKPRKPRKLNLPSAALPEDDDAPLVLESPVAPAAVPEGKRQRAPSKPRAKKQPPQPPAGPIAVSAPIVYTDPIALPPTPVPPLNKERKKRVDLTGEAKVARVALNAAAKGALDELVELDQYLSPVATDVLTSELLPGVVLPPIAAIVETLPGTPARAVEEAKWKRRVVTRAETKRAVANSKEHRKKIGQANHLVAEAREYGLPVDEYVVEMTAKLAELRRQADELREHPVLIHTLPKAEEFVPRNPFPAPGYKEYKMNPATGKVGWVFSKPAVQKQYDADVRETNIPPHILPLWRNRQRQETIMREIFPPSDDEEEDEEEDEEYESDDY